MTTNDAVIHLRQMREELARQLYLSSRQASGQKRIHIMQDERSAINQRITALDTVIVAIELLT